MAVFRATFPSHLQWRCIMKLLTVVSTALLLGFAGAASAECSWGKAHTTTAESDPVVILPEPEETS